MAKYIKQHSKQVGQKFHRVKDSVSALVAGVSIGFTLIGFAALAGLTGPLALGVATVIALGGSVYRMRQIRHARGQAERLNTLESSSQLVAASSYKRLLKLGLSTQRQKSPSKIRRSVQSRALFHSERSLRQRPTQVECPSPRMGFTYA